MPVARCVTGGGGTPHHEWCVLPRNGGPRAPEVAYNSMNTHVALSLRLPRLGGRNKISFVCACVWLSAGLRHSYWTDLQDIFWEGSTWTREQLVKLWCWSTLPSPFHPSTPPQTMWCGNHLNPRRASKIRYCCCSKSTHYCIFVNPQFSKHYINLSPELVSC